MNARQQHIESRRSWRRCLDCRTMFMSPGPWNRVCPRCTRRVRRAAQKYRTTAVAHGLRQAGKPDGWQPIYNAEGQIHGRRMGNPPGTGIARYHGMDGLYD